MDGEDDADLFGVETVAGDELEGETEVVGGFGEVGGEHGWEHGVEGHGVAKDPVSITFLIPMFIY